MAAETRLYLGVDMGTGDHCSVMLVNPSQAALDVLAERHRQMAVEGWTPAHDDQHQNAELPRAARSYALAAHLPEPVREKFRFKPPSGWPFSRDWWKWHSPRRMLVIAAALIIAEIERLDRMAGK